MSSECGSSRSSSVSSSEPSTQQQTAPEMTFSEIYIISSTECEAFENESTCNDSDYDSDNSAFGDNELLNELTKLKAWPRPSSRCIKCDERYSLCDCQCDLCNQNPNLCECKLCWICEWPKSGCLCPHCTDCGQKERKCDCRKCATCRRRYQFCECTYCPECLYTEADCECAECDICQGRSWECFCFGLLHQRTMIDNTKALQLINMDPLPVDQVWYRYPNRVIALLGDFHDKHIFVITKPSILGMSAVQQISRQAKDIWTRASTYTASKVTQTSLYKYGKTKWSRLVFHLEPTHEPTHMNINTCAAVRQMVSELSVLPRCTGKPVIGFDMEGNNLGRDGKACYLQIRDFIRNKTYLVDVQELGQKAFTTTGGDRKTTLKTMMEDKDIQMAIYDCRQDADVLNAHFHVQVQGVIDVQILRMLSYPYFWKYRTNYKTAMAQDGQLSPTELVDWNLHKSYSFGGDYSVFEQRPLPKGLKLYSINDVKYLLHLHDSLAAYLTERGKEIALEWSRKEVEATWADDWESSRARVDDGYSKYWKEKLHMKTRAG